MILVLTIPHRVLFHTRPRSAVVEPRNPFPALQTDEIDFGIDVGSPVWVSAGVDTCRTRWKSEAVRALGLFGCGRLVVRLEAPFKQFRLVILLLLHLDLGDQEIRGRIVILVIFLVRPVLFTSRHHLSLDIDVHIMLFFLPFLPILSHR